MSQEWFQLFYKALRAEEKQQYTNMKGRSAYFADFALKHVRDFEKTDKNARIIQRLENIFQLYPLSSVHERKAYIEEVYKGLEILQPPKKERKVSKPKALPADWRDTPVQYVKGVGPSLGQKFEKVGVHTVGELLHYYPRTHLDYSQCQRISELKVGELATVWGHIHNVSSYSPPGKPNLTIVKVVVRDGSGRMTISWFYRGKANYVRMQYQNRFPQGAQILLSGKVKWDKYTRGLTLDKPESKVLGDLDVDSQMDSALHVGRIVPIYPLTEGLNIKWVRKAIQTALGSFKDKIKDPLPAPILEKRGLFGYFQSLQEFHFPTDHTHLQQARRRLVFQELFMTQLGMQYRRKQKERNQEGLAIELGGTLVKRFLDTLPFELTAAQNRVYREICQDLQRPEPMSRLVQGDVGSGKTVVAILSLLHMVDAGFQGALMAPTEILAEQHYHKMFDWLYPLGIKVELLTGSQKTKARREARARLASGEAHIAVGTHALIQEGVDFKNLGLAVIDEQHRFGVKQRAILKSKGAQPEILTMTATPIPRTLALALYGDLDVSVIDELPPGRKPIQTQLLTARQRDEMWRLMAHEIAQGRQCYVVYPLVEESEKMDLKAATVEYETYQERFPHLRIGLLHGKMKGTDKDAVMRAFSEHHLDVLVATTVIEVGVDVPNASVMVIEHAERFGLAQLHQLRGRVGRGADKAYCLLVTDKKTEQSQERLKIFAGTTDGFVIAEHDLRIRGPGEFLGTRQSGLPDLILTNLSEDGEILDMAREVALGVMGVDPELISPKYAHLKLEMYRFFRANTGFLEA